MGYVSGHTPHGWRLPLRAARIGNLGNVDETGAADGDALVYDDGTDTWGPGGGGGSPVAVDDDGVEVVAAASRLNFADNLTVTDDGAGEVTIDALAGGGEAYNETVGDASEVTFDIVHGLGTTAVLVAVIEVTSGEMLVAGTDYGVQVLDGDTARLVFVVAPGSDDALVVVASGAPGGGGGGGGSEGLRSQAVVEDPDTWAEIVHGLGTTPQPGEIVIVPRNVDHDVVRWAVSDESASTFRVTVDPAPGTDNEFHFAWVWTKAAPLDPPTYQDVVTADGAVALWTFNERVSGTTYVDVIGSRTLSCIGDTPAVADGLMGEAVEVATAGSGNRLETTAHFGNLGEMTYECWVRMPTATHQLATMAQGSGNNNFTGLSVSDAQVEFVNRSSSAYPSVSASMAGTDLRDGEWHHVVGTFVRSTGAVALYVDGNLVAVGTSGTGSPTLSGFYLGNRHASDGLWVGQLDKVAVYDRVLTGDEVSTHYALGTAS
jgi:hypothetical protein